MAELSKALEFYDTEGCGFNPRDRQMPFSFLFCSNVHHKHDIFQKMANFGSLKIIAGLCLMIKWSM